MRTMFQNYFKTIGMALVGLAFGFAFFYLFLNLYHYQEIRRTTYFDASADASYLQLEETLVRIENNISSIQKSGNNSGINVVFVETGLKSCVNNFRNEEILALKEKKQLDIVDVYNLYNDYENKILNDCIVTKISSILFDNDKYEDLDYKKILKYYRDDLLQDTSYLKKDLNNNSTYHFSTDSTSITVKNGVRDSFYEVLSAYNRAAKFLEIVSEWYSSELGGAR